MQPKLIAGNWKMNGVQAQLAELAGLRDVAALDGVDVAICPPATLIAPMAVAAAGSGIAVGGQDCHANASGAHTGDLAAQMLADAGATYVITGHSERRSDHGETDADVAAKTQAGWQAGLHVILCIGETEAQYRAGDTLDVLRAQIDGSVPQGAAPENVTIAYEPVWAIGTGLTPTPEEIAAVHAALRAHLGERFGAPGASLRLLYGGSVKASNAAAIFALDAVDGALVGGASLKAQDFAPIVQALTDA